MKNPILSEKYNLLIYFFIWFCISIVEISILTIVLNFNLNYFLPDVLIANIIYANIGLSLWYPARFIGLENNSTFRMFGNHLASATISSAIWIAVVYFILINVFDESSKLLLIKQSIVWRFIIGIIYYTILVSFYYTYTYYRNFQEKKVKEIELQNHLREAELKTLKYQINPHFIFNSLNSISSLTLSNAAKAQEMTIGLSDYLRSTLNKGEHQLNSLKEELKNLRLFLGIEKIRFEDKFVLIENIDPNCENILVPNMLLQPLAENAIKYGVYESLTKIKIVLNCSREKEYLMIELINDFDPKSVNLKGEGIGLRNIKNRLKLIYNQENLLTTTIINDQFKVKILIPLEN